MRNDEMRIEDAWRMDRDGMRYARSMRISSLRGQCALRVLNAQSRDTH
jgi:hypothetical protein